MSVLNITTNNFQSEIMDSKQPVLIDFWGEGCIPCKRLSPVVEEIAQETPGLKVGKVNVGEQPELARRFGIMGIPTLVLLKEGRVVERSVGVKPKEAILDLIEK